MKKKVLSLILTFMFIISLMSAGGILQVSGSTAEPFVQSIGKPNLTMGTDWQNPTDPPFYPAHWNVTTQGTATYLVIEANARPENVYGFGGTILVLQGNNNGWDGWIQTHITGDFTSMDTTKKTFFIIDLTKLDGYSNFAASTDVNIIFPHMGNQIFYGANIENAWLTDTAFDTSKFTPASIEVGSGEDAIAGAVFFSQNFDWADYTGGGTDPVTPPSEIEIDGKFYTTGWGMMEKLGLGINIGNTMDANPLPLNKEDRDDPNANNRMPVNPIDSEISWQQPRIEKWQFEAMKLKGFDHVRIPITWEGHLDADFNINPAWLDRVQDVVDMAIASGLIVVINTHHERSMPQSLYGLSCTDYDGAKNWIIAVWTQIADRFEDYPVDKLLFEPFNEPYPTETHGWFWDYEHFATEILPYAQTINKLNQDALDVIRASGGNNEKRVIIQTVIQASSYLLKHYEPPANDPFTMVGIFFYPSYRTDHIQPALNKSIPVYIKEIAPIMSIGTDSGDLVQWVNQYFGMFKNMGIPVAYWNHWDSDPEDDWGIFDRNNGAWNTPLVNAAFSAYGRIAGADFTAIPPPVLPYELPWDKTEAATINISAPSRELAAADMVIVEHTGDSLDWYGFALLAPPEWDWRAFDKGHARITEEPGKIIFDLRGIDLRGRLHFGTGDASRSAQITKIYLTTEAGGGGTPFVPCGVSCKGEADCEKPCTTGGGTPFVPCGANCKGEADCEKPCTTGGGTPFVPCGASCKGEADCEKPCTTGGGGGGGAGGGGGSSGTTDTSPPAVTTQSGTSTIIIGATKAEIEAESSKLPVHQLKVNTAGSQTITAGTAYAGQNAVLMKYNTTTKKFEFVSGTTIATNGRANINVTATGDYIVIIQKTGDITGTGEVEVDDALEVLRHIAGLKTLDAREQFAANGGKNADIDVDDALNILRLIAGLINKI